MKALAEYKMTPEQWQILSALWESDKPVTQTDISYLTMKDKYTVSRIIDRLERDKWVTKEVNKSDRRSFLVRPTQKAIRHRDIIRRTLLTHFEGIEAILTAKENATLLLLLKKYRAGMEGGA